MVRELLEKLRADFKDKRVLVVGLGIQGGGVGVAKFFAELGATVTVTDLKGEEELTQSINQLSRYNINYSLGGHNSEDFKVADIIFKGPSVPWDLPDLVMAQEAGIPIEMEVSFFAEHCPARMIGVTGTRGKSTTTAMLYSVLKDQGRNVYLGGNVSMSSTINLLNEINETDDVVLELSSWQLSGFHKKKISPHIAVFTNFYPDHLNFYKNIEDYLYDKKAIYLYQGAGDYLIANEKLQIEIEKDLPKSKILYFKNNDYGKSLMYLRGAHNQENAAAVIKTAEILGLDLVKVQESVSKFTGLPYRQQIVGQKDNCIFINDTTSTTPVAAVSAIKTFNDKPVILILGGNAKNLPFDELIEELTSVDKIVLLGGSFTEQIRPHLEERYSQKIAGEFNVLEEAVLKAVELANSMNEKAYVLFSPGATSFAMFKNEFDRGDEFNNVVKHI